jgi:hypothetical protein
VVTASVKPDRATTTISSLNDLLGSRDEEPVTVTEQQGSSSRPFQLLRVPGEYFTAVQVHILCMEASANVIYHLHICMQEQRL